MGCTASKLDHEDTVRRCKERRRLIKDAVYARHHLAASHADYVRSLRLTGSALSSFAAGEPLSISGQTPAAVIFDHNTTTTTKVPHPPPSPSPSSVYPPPSPSVASSKLPHILSASSAGNRRRKPHQPPPPAKLPHILSGSSASSSPRSERSNFTNRFHPTAYQNSMYGGTPSQASSVWNWENFYPPSPPDSEFFEQKAREKQQNHHRNKYETETEGSEYDYFQPRKAKHYLTNGSVVDEEAEREEVKCSEWEDHDHYSTTSSSGADEEDFEEEKESRSGVGTRSDIGSSARYEPVRHHQKPPPPVYEGMRSGTAEKFDDATTTSSESYKIGGEISNSKMVVRHKDLKEIVDAIKEYFDKAASAGDQVSAMLEIGRAQLDRNFRKLKKTVYHSNNVFSTLSSSWTSKPPLAVKYKLDATTLDAPGGPKSLCSTLDRLLAWEQKLYEEVKAREGVKIEHEKKLSALQSQEYKGDDESKLDKTKASITRLQSLIIVTSQAVSTTSSAIIRLRDTDLVPQLIELCHGLMYMWKSMHQYHEIQNNIVQQVRGLVNQSDKGDSTSELHRQVTRDLEAAVSSWHSSFCRLIKFQRDFIRNVHGWFKLTLVPISNDDGNDNRDRSDVYAFCDEWKLALDRVPDTVASEAIKSFINVVHVISVKQSEELKIKKRSESVSKELEKKASAIRNLERKYYQSYSMVGIGMPDSGTDNGQLDATDPLAEKKSELVVCKRKVEDETMRHIKAVEVTRAMTLNNLQTGLPGVFQALTSFSSLFTDSLETVCTRSYAIK